MIRVLYYFEILPGTQQEFELAWREVAQAHRDAGHAALESVLLRDPLEPLRYLAISRWRTREHWEAQQNDAVDLQAYSRLRAVGTLQYKEVFEERGLMPG